MSEHLHHLEHFVMYSVLCWQIGLIIWLVLKNILPRIQKDIGTTAVDGKSLSMDTTKDPGVVETKVKKDIFIDIPDNKQVQIDEVEQKTVETQRDKLKELRQ